MAIMRQFLQEASQCKYQINLTDALVSRKSLKEIEKNKGIADDDIFA